MTDQDDDSDSTIVRQGKEAFLFAEMGRFAKDLQARPLQRLLEDLPGLMELPDAKYAIVSNILGKRMRNSDAERAVLQPRLEALRATGSADVQRRCAAVLQAFL